MTPAVAVREAWMELGNCLGCNPDLFFPEHGASSVAKSVCFGCVVRSECLGYAMANQEQHGIWGGLTPRERRRLRRTMKRGWA